MWEGFWVARSFARLGSALATYGATLLGSSVAVLDFSSFGSSLAVRSRESAACTESMLRAILVHGSSQFGMQRPVSAPGDETSWVLHLVLWAKK